MFGGAEGGGILASVQQQGRTAVAARRLSGQLGPKGGFEGASLQLPVTFERDRGDAAAVWEAGTRQR